MSKIYALFDTKADATQAFDRIYSLFDADNDIDVRVFENDSSAYNQQQGRLPAVPLPFSPGQPGIPVTGFFRDLDLGSDEQKYFRDRMGADSVIAVIESDDVHDLDITEIIRQNNGQMYQDH